MQAPSKTNNQGARGVARMLFAALVSLMAFFYVPRGRRTKAGLPGGLRRPIAARAMWHATVSGIPLRHWCSSVLKKTTP